MTRQGVAANSPSFILLPQPTECSSGNSPSFKICCRFECSQTQWNDKVMWKLMRKVAATWCLRLIPSACYVPMHIRN